MRLLAAVRVSKPRSRRPDQADLDVGVGSQPVGPLQEVDGVDQAAGRLGLVGPGQQLVG